jgi:Siphovirus Gp157
MASSGTVRTSAADHVPDQSSLIRSRTLFDIEESLVLLGEAIADAEELTPELQADFERYLGTACAKRDNVARFRSECENQAEAAKKEIATLGKRRKRFERKIERIDRMLLTVFATMNVPYLEGNFYTVSKVKNPDSVDIVDLDSLNDEYKRVSVSMPAEDWKFLLESISDERRQEVISRLFKHEVTAELADIRLVLTRQEVVAGACLKTHEYRVEIR